MTSKAGAKGKWIGQQESSEIETSQAIRTGCRHQPHILWKRTESRLVNQKTLSQSASISQLYLTMNPKDPQSVYLELLSSRDHPCSSDHILQHCKEIRSARWRSRQRGLLSPVPHTARFRREGFALRLRSLAYYPGLTWDIFRKTRDSQVNLFFT